MTSGVYTITNTTNGKVYIGLSCDIARRWRHHRRNMRNGLHDNRAMQADVNAVGLAAFSLAIIEETSPADLAATERKHYERLHAAGVALYNHERSVGAPTRNGEYAHSLVALRLQCGLSQQLLADRLGINPTVVAALESGLVLPSDELRARIGQLLSP